MGRTYFAFLILFLSGILMVQCLAEETENSEQNHKFDEEKKSIADPPADHFISDADGDQSFAEAPALSRKLSKHHSSDKSVAGGGVIIGGLLTAVFAAVYCYIRVTRRPSSSEGSTSTTAVRH